MEPKQNVKKWNQNKILRNGTRTKHKKKEPLLLKYKNININRS